jgi:hypothetical protein
VGKTSGAKARELPLEAVIWREEHMCSYCTGSGASRARRRQRWLA